MEHSQDHRSQIGNAIRKYRKRAGLTQERLAAAAGLTPNYLGLLERGGRGPSIEVLSRLASILRCKVRELIPF
ncbi:MAG: helix-turn-helix transcriptional regulator [Nitrospirae bacterium]|nr:helix-turn-helix transcriptional regulator [Nitrospirota bacterium]